MAQAAKQDLLDVSGSEAKAQTSSISSDEVAHARAAMDKLAAAARHVQADEARRQAEVLEAADRTGAAAASALRWWEAAGVILAVLVAAAFALVAVDRLSRPETEVADANILERRALTPLQASEGAPARDLALELDILRREVQTLQANIAQSRAEQQALSAQLSAARAAELEARLKATSTTSAYEKQQARLDRLERLFADQSPVGSIDKVGKEAAARKPLSGESSVARSQPDASSPLILKKVVDGVAHIQTHEGVASFGVGDIVPGAGMVRAIEKRDGRWLVFTKNSVIGDRQLR